MNPFVGMIAMFGFNYAPNGWAFCDGQILTIQQNQALFALLGVAYGGNGQTTFALPDLRGRVPIGMGQGTGLSNYTIGQVGGNETVTLNTSQMPAHTHSLQAFVDSGDTGSPAGALLANTGGLDPEYRMTAGPGGQTTMGSAIGSSGGNQSHPNLQPYLAINYCIALTGIFPPRQ